MAEQARSTSAVRSAPTRAVSPSRTLDCLRECGVEIERGMYTTTNWSGVPSDVLSEVARAYAAGESVLTYDEHDEAAWYQAARSAFDEYGFAMEVSFDARGTLAIEMLCRRCWGMGHMEKDCPSPRKFRTLSYAIAQLTNAKERMDARSTGTGAPDGGRRPPPRGQAGPFKPMPRNFRQSRSSPFRRFRPAGQGRARLAQGDDEEEPEPELDEHSIRSVKETKVETPTLTPSSAAPSKESVAVARRSVAMPVKVTSEAESYFESPRVAPPKIEQSRKASDNRVLYRPDAPDSNDSPSPPPPPPQPAPRRLMPLLLGMLAIVVGLLAIVAEISETLGTALSKLFDTMANARVGATATSIILLVFCVRIHGERIAPAPPSAAPPQWSAGPGDYLRFDQTLAIASPSSFDSVEECLLTRHAAPRPATTGAPSDAFTVCFDSGATSLFLPEGDERLLDNVTDDAPNVGVRVASGTHLQSLVIGEINSSLETASIVVDTFMVADDGSMTPAISAPHFSRAVIVRGLEKNTRLCGVIPARDRDGIYSYFNDDNSAEMSDCVRFQDGAYAFFQPGIECEVVFRFATDADRAAMLSGNSESAHSVVSSREPLEVHASLMHCASERIIGSRVWISGFDMSKLREIAAVDCIGCSVGCATKPPDLRSSNAPSTGVSERPRRPYGTSHPEPSTTGYTHYGQRVDTDLCVSFPPSWPHGFTCFANFCDRWSNDFVLFFQIGHSSNEVGGSLAGFAAGTAHRMPDGTIGRWHTDDDLSFEGPAVADVVDWLVENRTTSPPYRKNSNPKAERNNRTVQECIRACHAFADNAPECLWPWAAAQCENVLFFLSSKAHHPPASAYETIYENVDDADLSWAHPMYCDVVVRLPERDINGKVSSTGAEGFHLGRDFKRNCFFVAIPSLKRITSCLVTEWKPMSFELCKLITADTPVEYRDNGDLRYGSGTAAMLPGQFRGSHGTRAERHPPPPFPDPAPPPPIIADADIVREKEGGPTVSEKEGGLDALLIENARHITEGVAKLEERGVEQFIAEACSQACEPVVPLATHEADMSSRYAAMERALFDPGERTFISVDSAITHTDAAMVIELHGSERAQKAVAASNKLEFKTVDEAQKSRFWPLIKVAMEEEIEGKMQNGAFQPVARDGKRVMRSRWVIHITLNDDGSVKSVKARFVACGYSQVEGEDYDWDKIYSSTPPGTSIRLFASIVADEDLETDSVDAVKAFTQASLDRKLYVEMPIGFSIPGYCLEVYMALEGIRQGSYLWFKKNKWALNKCNMSSDMHEPNFYTSDSLSIIIIIVFADDIGAGFRSSVRAEYLSFRLAYSKLIKIDSPGPDMTVPITILIGINFEHDRAARTVKLHMRTYITKLGTRYKGKFTLNSMPHPSSKARREAFERMEVGASSPCDRLEFLGVNGSLAWPAAMVRPEIAYHSSWLGSFNASPQHENLDAGYYVIGYLVNTPSLGITYGGKLRIPLGLSFFPEHFHESRGLYAAADSSWGKSPRPQGGHVLFRLNGAVAWASRRLKVIADSTSEAETAEASRASKTVIFGRTVLEGRRRPVLGPTALLTDSSAMYDAVAKDGMSSRTRYFERATIFVKYAFAKLIVIVFKVTTDEMVADIFTKPVDEATFIKMRAVLLNMSGDGIAKAKVSRLVDALYDALHKKG